MAEIEYGSFRDPSARVFYANSAVYRALNSEAFENWQQLSSSAFYQRASDAGLLIATKSVTQAPEIPQHYKSEDVCGILMHEKIPFISYPYEWSFSMLKDAALLHLNLLEEAIAEDMILKDGTAFNIQWIGSRAVFIDIGSFEKMEQGKLWYGYRQFCQNFLNPLMLQAYKKIEFQNWFRGNIEGIPVSELNNVLSIKDWLRPGVFQHVLVHSWMEKYTLKNNVSNAIRNDIEDFSPQKQVVLQNVQKLRKVVNSLNDPIADSMWKNYTQTHSYTSDDMEKKKHFVRAAALKKKWNMVWDLGCNTGTFSEIVAENAKTVVAMDSDAKTVDILYNRLKDTNNKTILPLVMNFANPSPAQGFRGLERKSLEDRTAPDLIMALALIHHLVLGCNIPLADLVEWLSGFNAHVIIEFVSKEDEMAHQLSLAKPTVAANYELSYFEKLLNQYFNIVASEELKNGERKLFFLAPKSDTRGQQ